MFTKVAKTLIRTPFHVLYKQKKQLRHNRIALAVCLKL